MINGRREIYCFMSVVISEPQPTGYYRCFPPKLRQTSKLFPKNFLKQYIETLITQCFCYGIFALIFRLALFLKILYQNIFQHIYCHLLLYSFFILHYGYTTFYFSEQSSENATQIFRKFVTKAFTKTC